MRIQRATFLSAMLILSLKIFNTAYRGLSQIGQGGGAHVFFEYVGIVEDVTLYIVFMAALFFLDKRVNEQGKKTRGKP